MSVQLNVPQIELSIFLQFPLLVFWVILFKAISPISKQCIHEWSISSSHIIFIWSSRTQEIHLFEILAFLLPLTQLLQCLFISNFSYSKSFLMWIPMKFDNRYHCHLLIITVQMLIKSKHAHTNTHKYPSFSSCSPSLIHTYIVFNIIKWDQYSWGTLLIPLKH